jgi:hypothetical protein
MAQAGVDLDARAETLSLNEFDALAGALQASDTGR